MNMESKNKSNSRKSLENEGIQTIFKKLRDIGINKKYLHDVVFPEWWDREILNSESGVQEFILILSKNLGIPFRELFLSNHLTYSTPSSIEFKKLQNQKADKFQFYIHQCHSISNHLKVPDRSFSTLPKSAKEIRTDLLKNRNLHLLSLLEYLKEFGIFVIPPLQVPKKNSAPLGMVYPLENKNPIICLGSRRKSPTIQMFTILHELGHIVNGHLFSNAPIIDTKIEKDVTDQKEIEANQFAMEVFTGQPHFAVQLNANNKAESFARNCKQVGESLEILPEFLAINFGWNNPKYWSLVNKTLEILEEGNALEIVREFFLDTISSYEVGDEYSGFLNRLTFIE